MMPHDSPTPNPIFPDVLKPPDGPLLPATLVAVPVMMSVVLLVVVLKMVLEVELEVEDEGLISTT